MPNGKMNDAIKACKAYRRYLKEKGIPKHLATKGFLLTKEMITNLLNQDDSIAGIRIYVGLDETGDKTIKPYAVACVKAGTQYNDWKVPKGQQQPAPEMSLSGDTTLDSSTSTTLTSLSTTTEPEVEEPRPCPAYCSEDNDLNTDPQP
jgi:hypothetical protein